MEGNRPGVMDRLGLGWDRLRAGNPKLILCSITGYGQTGPWALRAGHDLNYMAIAGALGLNAEPGRDPHPLGVQVADIGAGAQGAATAILGALVDVVRGGEGRHLDVSMTDGALSWLAVPLAQMREEGQVPPRGGLRLTGHYACYRVYRCADGRFYSVGALEPKFWQELCEAVGRTDLVEQQFEEGQARLHVHREMERAFASRTRAEWELILRDRDVCAEPVLDLDEVLDHPHVRARELAVERPTGLELAPAVPLGQGWRRRDAPGLGEHTAEVLAEVGIDDDELAWLREAGAI
jgi:crotonobetainyl-CoA:carnitine CoA-transferase CaiB-like acyl-CoA transferase